MSREHTISPTVSAANIVVSAAALQTETYQIDQPCSTFTIGVFYANNDGSKGNAVVDSSGTAVVLSATNPGITFYAPAYIYFEKQASAGFAFGLLRVKL